MSGAHDFDKVYHDSPTGPSARKKIIKVFIILSIITLVEFLIAFAVGRGMWRNTTFILMTIVKAFFIVAEFMHMKHEAKTMSMTILLPFCFVIWLIVALLIEGDFISAYGTGLGGWFK